MKQTLPVIDAEYEEVLPAWRFPWGAVTTYVIYALAPISYAAFHPSEWMIAAMSSAAAWPIHAFWQAVSSSPLKSERTAEALAMDINSRTLAGRVASRLKERQRTA